MTVATVVVSGQPVRISLLEAPRIIEELIAALNEMEVMVMQGLNPPEITEDGYLSYQACRDFFAQVNDDSNWLNAHASKLFGLIVKQARLEKMNIRVLCTRCKKHVSLECLKGRRAHLSDGYPWMHIEVRSLRENSEKFLGGELRMAGPARQDDFRLLLAYLPGIKD